MFLTGSRVWNFVMGIEGNVLPCEISKLSCTVHLPSGGGGLWWRGEKFVNMFAKALSYLPLFTPDTKLM